MLQSTTHCSLLCSDFPCLISCLIKTKILGKACESLFLLGLNIHSPLFPPPMPALHVWVSVFLSVHQTILLFLMLDCKFLESSWDVSYLSLYLRGSWYIALSGEGYLIHIPGRGHVRVRLRTLSVALNDSIHPGKQMMYLTHEFGKKIWVGSFSFWGNSPL